VIQSESSAHSGRFICSVWDRREGLARCENDDGECFEKGLISLNVFEERSRENLLLELQPIDGVEVVALAVEPQPQGVNAFG